MLSAKPVVLIFSVEHFHFNGTFTTKQPTEDLCCTNDTQLDASSLSTFLGIKLKLAIGIDILIFPLTSELLRHACIRILRKARTFMSIRQLPRGISDQFVNISGTSQHQSSLQLQCYAYCCSYSFLQRTSMFSILAQSMHSTYHIPSITCVAIVTQTQSSITVIDKCVFSSLNPNYVQSAWANIRTKYFRYCQTKDISFRALCNISNQTLQLVRCSNIGKGKPNAKTISTSIKYSAESAKL